MTRIYHLIDPILNQPVYVGATIKSLEHRLKQHIAKPQSNWLRGWIEFLEARGETPRIELIAEVDDEDAGIRERVEIQQLAETCEAFCLNGTFAHTHSRRVDWTDRKAAYMKPGDYVADKLEDVEYCASSCREAVGYLRKFGLNRDEIVRVVAHLVEDYLDRDPQSEICDYPDWLVERTKETGRQLVESMKRDVE